MTFDERVNALEPLGFSERQTRFLVTVALHSGFCLRRHYTAFAGLKYGAGVRDFLDRLVARKLATRLDFRPDRGHVYHLNACSIYAAIEQDDNRNRRRTSPALIARKLMLLDYVLGEPAADWYATEQDKVALFTTRFGVLPTNLPQRVYLARRRGDANTTRYFIHKLPIRVAGEPPTVSLVFLVTDTTGAAFEQFLQDHLRFLNYLPDWRIVAVAPRHIPGIPACETAFRRFVVEAQQPRSQEEVEALRTYFVTLDQIERNDLPRVTSDSIRRHHDARRRFAAPEFEGLFRRWLIEGGSALGSRGADGFLAAIRKGRGQLLFHRLAIRYDRFGTRAGVV
jgi:hypothetical protein